MIGRLQVQTGRSEDPSVGRWAERKGQNRVDQTRGRKKRSPSWALFNLRELGRWLYLRQYHN